MSYQALARQYRPRSFAEVVGQQHVVSALSNALATDRVHHALLFSGTRGVGKTTLARIFAKSLNCETNGVSADPCGTCGSCTSVDEGRFIDLIEVDAASRTRVEDTRDLLDNVQYAPTQGAYKVYLIDEVHMLSNHSFNALLKTLEEPPPHVKFLLATTDPQKLPVTVLSRCLQFNLRSLDVEEIRGQLTEICGNEKVEFEPGALDVLARSADGSMRDGLSLLDQALAHGSGKLVEVDVRNMLGMIDDAFTIELLRGLASEDAASLLEVVSKMSERSCDFTTALDEILLALHDVALEHYSPGATAKAGRDPGIVEALGDELSPEDVQLFYQLGLVAKRDLAVAPDPRSGFEMALLRMIAFRPAIGELASAPAASSESSGSGGVAVAANAREKMSSLRKSLDTDAVAAKPAAEAAEAATKKPATPAEPKAPAPAAAEKAEPGAKERKAVDGPATSEKPADRIARMAKSSRPADPEAAADAGSETAAKPQADAASNASDKTARDDATEQPSSAAGKRAPDVDAQPARKPSAPEPDETVDAQTGSNSKPDVDAAAPPEAPRKEPKPAPIKPEALMSTEGWSAFVTASGLGGLAGQLARNAVPENFSGDCVTLVVDEDSEHLNNDSRARAINKALSTAFGRDIELEIKLGQPNIETPAAAARQKEQDRQASAERSIHEDPNVQSLIDRFDATIVPDSITPGESGSAG